MRRSSGDPIADRRYAYGAAAAAEGDWRTAADVLDQTVEIAPLWAPAWVALGEARERLGEAIAASEAYRAALRLDPEDSLGAGPRLARLSALSPAALPSAYIRDLFDDYAPRYARHLTEGLAYRGPAAIVEALDKVAPGRTFALAYDLGCGDGMMGAALRTRVGALVGADLSPAMITKAKQGGLYDELEAREICAFLEGREAAVDLIVAADVLPYCGDLARLFRAAADRLAPRGVFVVTAESCDGDGYRLNDTLRFAHSGAYLARCGRENGLALERLSAEALRREKGHAAPGWVAAYAPASREGRPPR
jgi:predicted TPR repeat methyltransferase